jgi:hypothetical protein
MRSENLDASGCTSWVSEVGNPEGVTKGDYS